MAFATEEDIINYYVNQAGSGMGAIYSGPLYQKGYGIGSFLGGLFRAVLPLIKSRGLSIGKHLLKTGVDVLGDVQENKSFKTSLSDRKNEIINSMKDAVINGKGYLRRKSAYPSHSSTISRRSNTIKKKKVKQNKKKLKRDIFGCYNGIHK
jgi:hypothetical protein